MQTISAKTVILKDVSGNYLLPYVEPTPLVTTVSDGLMSKEDKIKLDSMSEGGSGTGEANINDDTTSTVSTWSSTKINTELDKKLDPSNIIAGNNVIISRDGKNLTISAIGGESSSGEGFADPTILQNYYTKVETDNKYALKTSEHTHANKGLLDNFTVDAGGILRYNGNIIPVNPSELSRVIEGEYTEIKKIEYDMCQFSAPDLNVGYISLNPGFTQTLDFNTYVVDKDTVIENNLFIEVPRDFDDKLTPLYNYRTGSEMYSFEVWSDAFVEDMTGLGSTAIPRKILLQAYGMDEMSLARVALIDCSYLFGKPTRPYLAVFIRGLNRRWRTVVAYNFYNATPDSVVGNGIGRYTIGLQHWVWEQIQNNTLKCMDLDKLSKSNKNRLDSMKETIDELYTRVSNNAEDIAVLQTRFDQLNSDLITGLANVEQRLVAIENDVSSMLLRLEALEARNGS